MARRKKDWTGYSRGELRVLREATSLDFEAYERKSSPCESSMNTRFWVVQCTCGQRVIMSSFRLTVPKHVKSCGCKKKRGMCRRVTDASNPIDSVRRDVFTSTKSKAKHRGIQFNLNYEQFCELAGGNCFYCDSPPVNRQKPKRQQLMATVKVNTFYHNGIDRVDNCRGYEPDNVVSCCIKCNQAKNDLTLDEFYRWIRSVKKHKKKELESQEYDDWALCATTC